MTARTLRAFDNEWFLRRRPALRREIERDMENAIAAGRAGQANELELERMRLQLEVMRRKRLELGSGR